MPAGKAPGLRRISPATHASAPRFSRRTKTTEHRSADFVCAFVDAFGTCRCIHDMQNVDRAHIASHFFICFF
jgi:hypothetical protein